MILGAPGSEQFRNRTGWLILACGVALVIWAWGNWLYRASTPDEAAMIGREIDAERRPSGTTDGVRDGLEDEAAGGKTNREAVVRAMPLWLVVTLLLVLAFLFGSSAIFRASRRYHQTLDRRRAPPTASDDVWSMHKLPDESDDTDESLS